MPYRVACLIAVFLAQLLPAAAQDFVVLDASAPGFEPGRALRTGDRIDLPAGAALALISASGEVLRLAGPFSGALRATAAGQTPPPGALASLTAILARAAHKTQSLGAAREAEATRSAGQPGRIGTVWNVDGGLAGAQCVKAGSIELLRREAGEALDVTVWPLSGGAQKVEWRAGERSLVLGAETGIGSGTQLSIAGGKSPVAIILWQLPRDIDVTEAGKVLLWFSARGCDAQAVQLATEIAGGGPVRE